MVGEAGHLLADSFLLRRQVISQEGICQPRHVLQLCCESGIQDIWHLQRKQLQVHRYITVQYATVSLVCLMAA